jgi:hypothetical protein
MYYNGNSVQFGGAVNLNNTTNAIRIGARGPADFQRFDGRLALVRISNTAKYSAPFTPTVTYGVDADTELFLGSDTPLVDTSASARTITNNGVTASTTFVNRYTATHSAANQGSSGVHIDSNPTNDAWATTVPIGARIISSVTGRFTVNATAQRDANSNWVFNIGAGPIGGFTAGETHTFIW